jgi:hypothetical protein
MTRQAVTDHQRVSIRFGNLSLDIRRGFSARNFQSIDPRPYDPQAGKGEVGRCRGPEAEFLPENGSSVVKCALKRRQPRQDFANQSAFRGRR